MLAFAVSSTWKNRVFELHLKNNVAQSSIERLGWRNFGDPLPGCAEGLQLGDCNIGGWSPVDS
jgi:hypothetical protein